jgi:hypothetical protein
MFASTKTAKVEYRMRGDALHMFVLQAMGKRQVEAAQVNRLAEEFGKTVWRTIDRAGFFKSWDIASVGIESTRGGLAFRTNVVAQLREPSQDIYDRAFTKILKDAFKYHGIAF